MPKRKPFTVTLQEAHVLFQVSAKFGLPEKLGKKSYDVAERGLAVEEARALFRELRSMTPDYDRQERILRFGPLSNWEENSTERGQWSLINPEETVTLRLNEDAHMGAFWCLVLALHPASPFVTDARSQDEVTWPLAEKLRLVKMVRKEMDMADAKKRRLELDDDGEGAEPDSDDASSDASPEEVPSAKPQPASVKTE